MENTVRQTSSGRWNVRIHKIDMAPLRKAAPDIGETRKIEPTDAQSMGREYLAPTFSPLLMAQMRENSPSLATCLMARQTNVMGFGWELQQASHIEKTEDLPPQAEEERERLIRLFEYPNYAQSFLEMAYETMDDFDSIGAAYWEVVRSRKGDIVELQVLPAFSVRLTPRDEAPIVITHRIRSTDGTFYDQPRFYRFRRFVQLVSGQTKRYFKEFGDPRPISYLTGMPISSADEQATEVIMFRQGPSYDPYGQPPWIAAAMDILGDRKANIVNYTFFENKSIPPYILMIAGGSVDAQTIKELEDFFREQIDGIDNYHKGLVIEATPMDIGDVPGEKVSTPKIEFKPLTQFLANDAQFLKYHDKCDRVVREQFRIPPIYFGAEGQYNFATALAAVRLAEQQVFAPVRRRFEDRINATILTAMEINFWTLRLKAPAITDHIAMLGALGLVKEAVPIGVIQETVDDMRGVSREIAPELYEITLADQNRTALEGQLAALNNQPTDEEKPGDEANTDKVEKWLQRQVGQVLQLRKAVQTELNKRGGGE